MSDYRDPLRAATERIDALERELAEERNPAFEKATTAIARNPRRAWPLVVIVGVPVALVVGFSVWLSSLDLPDTLGSVLAMVAAVPLFIWGSYALFFSTPRRPRAAVPLVLGALALLAGFVRDVRLPGNQLPTGWSPNLPRYPGVLAEAEVCNAKSGGATFRTLRMGGKNHASGVVSYARSLKAAGLPSEGFVAECPLMRADCTGYKVGALHVIECYADPAKTAVRVRYGTSPCPLP